jgi:plasmid maintenance system antidote protein VapI
MLAPIDFIKEKYIIPNNITQDMLCDSLNIGKRTISELYQKKRGFTLHTAKKFAKFFGLKPEFIMMKQVEYDLMQDKEEYENIKAFVELQQETQIENNAKWILATINNSISNETNHYTIDDLNNIFQTPSTDKKFHYAITILFKEVDYNDVIKYCELNNINRANIKKLYDFYKTTYNAKKVNEYEWLFKEL